MPEVIRPLHDPDLEQLREILRQTPSISSGGCGVSAYILWSFFTSRGHQAYIVYGYLPDHEEYIGNDDFLNGHEAYAGSCSHAFVHLPEYNLYVDPHEEVFQSDAPSRIGSVGGMDDFHFIPSYIVERFMLPSLMNKRVWNSSFQRDKYLPALAIVASSKFGLQLPVLWDIIGEL